MDPNTDIADDIRLVHDEVDVVPAAQAWAERIQASFRPQPVGLFANDVARLLQRELSADSVTLWCREGDDLIVLGAAGLNPRMRNSRVAPWDPVLDEAAGDDIRYDHTGHRPPRASEVPGMRASQTALLWVPAGTPVTMVTVSGPSVPAGVEDAIRDLLLRLPWDQATG